MRKPRIKNDGEGYYHIVSRCALQQFLLSPEGKSVFVDMLRRIAIFSGIELLNYCVMDNHFHILAHVPIPTEITEEMLIYRVKTLYGADQAQSLKDRWTMYRHGNHLKRLEEEQMMLKRRMGDITPFIQNLKQRFSIWYHAHNPNTGSMWEGRFYSTLLEGTAHTLSTVSAYIDLNPVRAGIVDDPKDYKWSGYASALRGNSNAMHGIARIYNPDAKVSDFKKHIETYRQKLYLSGTDVFPAEKIQEIIDKKGELPLQILLRCKVRHFTCGAIFGSKDFVDEQVAKHKYAFSLGRKTGARGIGLCKNWDGIKLYSARDLQKSPVSFQG
jgi:REP element-mobilizing transposase RayT